MNNMRKTYKYKNLTFEVADNQPVRLSLKNVSDGNISHTVVNIPGDDDPEFKNEGTAILGPGKKLKSERTLVITDLSNMVPVEDEIRIQYFINGQLLIEHFNLKSEEANPIIILVIKFI